MTATVGDAAKAIFRAENPTKGMAIITLDLAESLFRRDARGIDLKKLSQCKEKGLTKKLHQEKSGEMSKQNRVFKMGFISEFNQKIKPMEYIMIIMKQKNFFTYKKERTNL